MTLAREWRRHLFGGLAGASALPAALLIVLLTLAFAGGLAPLGVLGQALSGPRLPAPPGPPALARSARPLPPPALAALAVPPPPAATASTPSRALGRHGPAPAPAPVARTVPGRPVPPRAAPHPGRPSGASAPARPAPPPRRPTAVDELVGAGTAVTSLLPAPAGPLGAATLQAAGSAADQVLPPASPSLP